MKNETQAKFVAAPRRSTVFSFKPLSGALPRRRYTQNYEH